MSSEWHTGVPYGARDSFASHGDDSLLQEGGERPQNLPSDRYADLLEPKGGDNDKYVAVIGDLSFSVGSMFTQRFLTHPCLVFRNQCQLNTHLETGYKLFPWSIIRPMHNIYKNQGVMALWKGLHNDIIISTVRKSVEVILSENTSLPLTLDGYQRGNIVNMYSKHMLLKGLSTLVATPLICAGYTLRVQSQVVVNDVNYFSIFPEAYRRIISSVYSHNSETSHLLPLYKLVAPMTVLCLGSYIIHGMSTAAVQRQYQLNTVQLHDESTHDEIPMIKIIYDKYYPQLLGAFCGHFIADVFFYPLSTITGRLILQGTRTIIDDVETGNAVLPFASTYTGVVNCMQTVLNEEGVLGLYKGFGALVMQYTVQVMPFCHLPPDTHISSAVLGRSGAQLPLMPFAFQSQCH